MNRTFRRTLVVISLAAGVLSLGALADDDGPDFVQTNLVSNISGLATVTDSNLANPWGVSHSSTSPFWVSNQGTNTATLYAVTDSTTVSKVPLTVAIPTTSGEPQGPTGQVNNSNASSFPVKNGGSGASAHFIFANLNGTISAWNGGPMAFIQVTTVPAVYTGLTINGAQTRLYAANAVGRIDVFDSSFSPVTLAPGQFVDPRLPAGLVPFGIQDISGDVYVTYAPAGHPAQTAAPLGAGAVAIFDENGNFIKQFAGGGRLAAPWGIALAPPSFGRFGSDLLIGNFSYVHSEINAFDPTDGRFRGTLRIDAGANLPGGLWYIGFGIGGNNGSPDTLYFADGVNGERDGLFGALSPNPQAQHECKDCDRGDDDK